MIINKKTYAYLMLLIPFFKPVGLAEISIFNSIMQLWKLVSIATIAVCLILNNRKLRLNKRYYGIYGFVVFGGIYVINCFRFGNNYSSVLNNVVTDIVLMLFIISMSNKKLEKLDAFLVALKGLFMFWIIIQFISIFMVRAGIWFFAENNGDYYYVFGSDNYSAFIMIPMMVIVFYIDSIRRQNKHRLISITLCGMITAAYIYTNSVTAYMACLVLLVFMLLNYHLKTILKYITVKRVIAMISVLLFLILRYNIQNFFLSFISNVLGKGDKASTLNSRTIIWGMAVKLIKEKPLLGYGAFSQESINSYILYGVGHTHNILLELLVRTGIIGTIGYLFFLIKSLTQKYNKLIKPPVNIILCGIIVVLALSMMDVYPLMQPQYVLFALAYSWDNIERKYAVEKNV